MPRGRPRLNLTNIQVGFPRETLEKIDAIEGTTRPVFIRRAVDVALNRALRKTDQTAAAPSVPEACAAPPKPAEPKDADIVLERIRDRPMTERDLVRELKWPEGRVRRALLHLPHLSYTGGVISE